MKRKEEVSIITEALLEHKLIEVERVEEARAVIKGALKNIRVKKYEEKQKD